MGALFSKKKKYWVPEHRKLEDKVEDLSKWKVVEDMTGWQVQNSADKIGEAMAKSKATAEVNLSFNGLGDDECEAIANAIKQTKTIKRIILANNHIHETGAEVRSSLTSWQTLPHTSVNSCMLCAQPFVCFKSACPALCFVREHLGMIRLPSIPIVIPIPIHIPIPISPSQATSHCSAIRVRCHAALVRGKASS
jgi:hypothetical protein